MLTSKYAVPKTYMLVLLHLRHFTYVGQFSSKVTYSCSVVGQGYK